VSENQWDVKEQQEKSKREVDRARVDKARRRRLYFSAAPTHDDDDTVVGAVASLLDVAQRKLAAESLGEAEERYWRLIEKSNDGITIVKVDVHLYASQRFAPILGYENGEDLVGRRLSDTMHPDDRDLIIEFV